MLVQILGVHAVDEAPDPCHLIELALTPSAAESGGVIDSGGTFDASAITQVVESEPRAAWQQPMELHQLDPRGLSGVLLEALAARTVAAPARLAFFFHFLRLDRPLLTPAGPHLLPAPSARPERLHFLVYS